MASNSTQVSSKPSSSPSSSSSTQPQGAKSKEDKPNDELKKNTKQEAEDDDEDESEEGEEGDEGEEEEEEDDLSDEEEISKEAMDTASATRASIEQFYKNFFKSVKERENRYE